MSQIVTGEAVAVDLRVARVGSRIVAASLDWAVQVVALLVLAWVLRNLIPSIDDALATAVLLVVVVAVLVGYPVGMETATKGRTLGKMAMGLRVVRRDGGPIRFRHALVRGLVGVFLEKPGLTFGSAALICSLVNRDGQRVGDLAAGTVVLQERVPAARSVSIAMPPALAPWAQTLDLSRFDDSLALAVRSFLARAPELTDGVREQMGAQLAARVVALVSPPPPNGTPGWAYLAAVLAERRRRSETLPGTATTPQPPDTTRPAAPAEVSYYAHQARPVSSPPPPAAAEAGGEPGPFAPPA